jgi:hypothetical protein
VLARPVAIVLVACAAFTDISGAHGAAFLFALAAMPALLAATLVGFGEVPPAEGTRARRMSAFQALLSVAALGLLGVTLIGSSKALLAAQIPGTPVPALVTCLGVFMLQWALAVGAVGGRAPKRSVETRTRAEPEPAASETRRRRAA